MENMKKTQMSIRLDDWIIESIKEAVEKNNRYNKVQYNFSEMLREMLIRGRVEMEKEINELVNSHNEYKDENILTNLPISSEKGNEKIGRNSPCPCGSGKKYKNCCGK